MTLAHGAARTRARAMAVLAVATALLLPNHLALAGFAASPSRPAASYASSTLQSSGTVSATCAAAGSTSTATVSWTASPSTYTTGYILRWTGGSTGSATATATARSTSIPLLVRRQLHVHRHRHLPELDQHRAQQRGEDLLIGAVRARRARRTTLTGCTDLPVPRERPQLDLSLPTALRYAFLVVGSLAFLLLFDVLCRSAPSDRTRDCARPD